MEAMTLEREAFEALIRQWPSYSEKLLMRDRHAPGDYDSLVVQGAWEGWKARAHLSQPAQAVDVAMIDRGAEAAWNMVPRGVAWGDASDHIQQEWKNIASVILTRALSAQKAGPVGGGWQPIETAPKDGTPIFIPYCGRPVPAVWNEHDAEWRWVFLSHGRDNAHREAAVKLWHPMTLPASPTPDKEG